MATKNHHLMTSAMTSRSDLCELLSTPMTKHELAAVIGKHHSTAADIINENRANLFIAEWVRGSRGPITPKWQWGNQPDAPKPAPYTQRERCARYRQTENGKEVMRKWQKHWKKSEEGQLYQKAYSSARYARDKFETGGVAAIDPLMAVFYRG